MSKEPRELAESEFIKWAERERWKTPREAVFVLHGQLPERCTTDELVERFPDSRTFLERYYLKACWTPPEGMSEDEAVIQLLDARDNPTREHARKQQEALFAGGFAFVDKMRVQRRIVRLEAERMLPTDAQSWIEHACEHGHNTADPLAEQWRFIYTVRYSELPFSEKFGEQMDYSYLRWCYLKNTKLPARALGMYTLNLSPRGLNSAATEQLKRLLFMIVPGEDETKTETTRVPTRHFIDNFPHELFDLDRRCVEIRDWTARYPDIAAWLAAIIADDGRFGLPPNLNPQTLANIQQTYDNLKHRIGKAPSQMKVKNGCGHARSTVREYWHFVKK